MAYLLTETLAVTNRPRVTFLKTMQNIEITTTPEYLELVVENKERGEKTFLYARENSTAVVKMRGDEMLEFAVFGDGPMQKFREMYLKEHPLTEREITRIIYGDEIAEGQ